MINLIKKLANKLSVVIFAILIVAPYSAHAASGVTNLIQERSEKIQDTFQQALFAATKSDVVDDMSALIPLMGFLMLINIFSVLYKSGPDRLVVEMAKMAFWAVVAGGIMGGATYKAMGTASMFSIHKNICGTEYNYEGGVSLDRDIFNFMKSSADDFACSLFSENVNHKYNQAVSNMFLVLTDMKKIPGKCMNIASSAGSGGDTEAILDCIREVQQHPEELKDKCGTGITGVGCYLSEIVTMIHSFGITAIVDLFLILIQIVVQTIQFIMMFAMIIGVGGSLLMLKLISPFLVMENVRGRVLQACKVPLAVAFFGFTQKTLLYFISGLMNAVTTASLICFAQFGAGGDIDGVMVVYLMVAMACLALMAMQIVVILKVPKFALMLVNLSLHELVNIGGEMLKAAFGMSTAAGFAIATGGASSIAGAAGAAGKMGSQAAAQGASWLGSKLGGAGSMMGMGPTGAGSPPNPKGKAPFVNRGGRERAGEYQGKVLPFPPRQQEESSPSNQNVGGAKFQGSTGDNGILKKKNDNKKKKKTETLEKENSNAFSDSLAQRSSVNERMADNSPEVDQPLSVVREPIVPDKNEEETLPLTKPMDSSPAPIAKKGNSVEKIPEENPLNDMSTKSPPKEGDKTDESAPEKVSKGGTAGSEEAHPEQIDHQALGLPRSRRLHFLSQTHLLNLKRQKKDLTSLTHHQLKLRKKQKMLFTELLDQKREEKNLLQG